MDNEKQEFIQWFKSRGRLPRTIENYLYYYNKFGGMENLNQEFIDKFLKAHGYNTIVVAFVKNYIEFLKRKGKNFTWIIIERVKRSPRKEPRMTTEKEVIKIASNMNQERDKLMLYISFYSGLRCQELFNLRVRDIRTGGILVKGKGNKERFCHSKPEILRRLNLFIIKKGIQNNLDSKIFFNLSMRRWAKILSNACIKALGESRNPHSLRHGFGTHLSKEGIDINSIREMMGHANIETTKLYIKFSPEQSKQNYLKAFQDSNSNSEPPNPKIPEQQPHNEESHSSESLNTSEDC